MRNVRDGHCTSCFLVAAAIYAIDNYKHSSKVESSRRVRTQYDEAGLGADFAELVGGLTAVDGAVVRSVCDGNDQ